MWEMEASDACLLLLVQALTRKSCPSRVASFDQQNSLGSVLESSLPQHDQVLLLRLLLSLLLPLLLVVVALGGHCAPYCCYCC